MNDLKQYIEERIDAFLTRQEIQALLKAETDAQAVHGSLAADEWNISFELVRYLQIPTGYTAIAHHLFDEILHERGYSRETRRISLVADEAEAVAARQAEGEFTEASWNKMMDEVRKRAIHEYHLRMLAGMPWQDTPPVGSGELNKLS